MENIANRFGIPLTPNALDGGLNYAEGGARVTLPNPSAQGLSQNSVSVQIDRFLASGGSFRKNDIVTMLIGPNDLFQGGPTAAAPAATAVMLNSDACRTRRKEHHPAQCAGHRLHSAVWFRNRPDHSHPGGCSNRDDAGAVPTFVATLSVQSLGARSNNWSMTIDCFLYGGHVLVRTLELFWRFVSYLRTRSTVQSQLNGVDRKTEV